jgi:hypothetical protein
MLRIEAELVFARAEAAAPEVAPQPTGAADLLLEAITAWWAGHIAGPFSETSLDVRLPPLEIPWRFADQSVTFGVRFDDGLLEDLVEAYAAFGWEALEEIERQLELHPARYEPTRTFFRVTRNVVGALVAHGLVELEEHVVAYAATEWEAAVRRLEGYERAFRNVGFRGEDYRLVDRRLAAELLELCRAYGREAAEARRLGAEVESRRRKSPPGTREKGSGWELWFEAFAAPQRAAMDRMVVLLGQVAELFPAAALVLDDLPESVIRESSRYRQLLASIELEHQIHRMLRYLLDELAALRTGLQGPRATAALEQRLAPLVSGPRDFTSLPGMQWPEGGPEALVMATVFERTERTDQRLLASLDLVASVYGELDEASRGGWSQIVLYRYLTRLEQAVLAERESAAAWEAFWAAMRRVTALMALVALMAVFPFGDAATLPAMASVLTLCASGAAILGVVTLLVHDVLGSLERAGKLETDARDRFFRLSQTDPEAVTEIADLLTRSRTLRDGVARGLLLTILTLGASHRLKPVAAALEFEGFASDVETLFAPEPSPGGP